MASLAASSRCSEFFLVSHSEEGIIASLTKIGEDLALILKPELIERLGLDRESRLEVTQLAGLVARGGRSSR